MTQSWASIFSDLDEPIRGRSYSYDRAESSSRTLERATRSCGREFARISSSKRIDELGGQAADQLGVLVSDLDGSFDELPDVFGDLVDIFDDHGRELRALELAAADALARAKTNWNELETARRNKATADAAARRITSQLDSLRYSAAPDDPIAAYEVGRLENQQWSANNSCSSASTAVRCAEADLEDSRAEYRRLREREEDLVERTVRRLSKVDLGDLKDPNRLVELAVGAVRGIANFGVDMIESYVNMVTSLAKGDFLDALWHLSDYLEKALTVLAIVGLAVAVFATGGAALVVAGLVIGGIKLGADAILAGTQHPHPETGQTRTWGEVAVDAVLLVVTAATAGLGSSGIRGTSRLPKRTLGQVITGVSPNSVTHDRTLITNVGNWINPTVKGNAAIGMWSMANAAKKKVIADAIDHGVDEGTSAIGDLVKQEVASGPLTTDAEVWTNPVLVDFMADSPMRAEGVAKINVGLIRVDQFRAKGPSGAATSPVFQLAGAE